MNTFQVFGSPGNPNTTRIDNLTSEENSVSVFPNPTVRFLTIVKTTNSAERIQLISMEGKLLRDVQSANNRIEFDLSDLANGIYFLKIGNETRKVILSR